MTRTRTQIVTANAPPPVGAYSQAIAAAGLLFIAGQTPRRPDGTRIGDAPFEEQARQALRNVESICRSAGTQLKNALTVMVFLKDMADASTFDKVYREFVEPPFPARGIVQSDLPGFALEVVAVVCGVASPFPRETGRA